MGELNKRTVKSASIANFDGSIEYTGTEWYNGEGIDFVLSDDEKITSLHMDEIEAIIRIANSMGFWR